MSEQVSQSRPGLLTVLRFDWSLLKAWQRWAIVVSGGIATLLVLAGAADAALSRGRVHSGVRVSGVELGRLRPAEATRRLRAVAVTVEGRPVLASVRDASHAVWPSRLDFRLDVAATVDRAYRVGRRGFPRAFLLRMRGWFAPVEVEPVVRYDSRRLDIAIAALAGKVDRRSEDARVIDIDGHPVAVPASDGLQVQRSAARAALLAALSSASARRFELPVAVTTPRIGTDAARGAAAELEIAISEPLLLTYKDRSWRVKGPVIRRWMTVTPKATTDRLDGPLDLVVAADPERVGTTIARITEPLVKPAIDARFEVDGNAVRVAPSRTGLAVDTKAAYDLVVRRLAQVTGARTVGLTLHSVQPKLTTAMAKEMGIRQRISSYTTEFSSSNEPRVNNIHLLAGALNNTLVAPGGEFSFNRTIGPRTAEKGYQEAPVIMNGRLVPALGGGICQVGTTIFNTVFFSGLPVVERTNHSFYISHYPDGRDATVSWGGPDFRFSNTTKHWILIKAWWSSSTVTIALYGSDPGYDVEYRTGQWRNRVSFPVREVADASMLKGSKAVEESGVPGHDVTVVRVVKKNGRVVREDQFASHYRAKEQVIRVGTKPPPEKKPSKPATTTPEPTGPPPGR